MERKQNIRKTVLAIAALLLLFNWYIGYPDADQIDVKVKNEIPLDIAAKTYVVKPGSHFIEKYSATYIRKRTLIPFVFSKDTIATSKREVRVEISKDV